MDQVVVYMTSRLWRNAGERFRDRERLRKAAVGIAPVSGPDLDCSSADGRMLAGILGEVDEHESGVKAERVARAAEKRAQDGQPKGGGAVRVAPGADLRRPGPQALVPRCRGARGCGGRARDRGPPAGGGQPEPHRAGPDVARGPQPEEQGLDTKLGAQGRSEARQRSSGRSPTRGAGPGRLAALIREDEHARVTALLGDPSRHHSRPGPLSTCSRWQLAQRLDTLGVVKPPLQWSHQSSRTGSSNPCAGCPLNPPRRHAGRGRCAPRNSPGDRASSSSTYTTRLSAARSNELRATLVARANSR